MKLQAEEMKKSPLAAMESEYSEILKQIDNINNAIAAGIWSSSTVGKLKALEASADSLKDSIAMLRYSQSQLLDRDRVRFFLNRFTRGDRNDPLLRRQIIETFINAVYVYDDHLLIVVNNLEGNNRVSLEELADLDVPECSDNDASGSPSVSRPNTRITIYRVSL